MFFLGNTDPKKNTPNVLKAFADFNKKSARKFKLVMLDYEENALQQVLNDIGCPEIRPDIVMAGYVPNSEMPLIINQCKVFLYPSLRESFGIPILEGMACGVPVIASPVGVNVDIVEPGVNGFLASTEAEWRSAIATLQADPDLRARMGAAGRKKVEQHYSLQVWGPRVASAMAGLARRRQT